METTEHVYEVVTPYKYPTENMPTMLVTVGNVKGEK